MEDGKRPEQAPGAKPPLNRELLWALMSEKGVIVDEETWRGKTDTEVLKAAIELGLASIESDPEE